MAQSAVKNYDKPASSLAFAAVENQSRFTRFSSSGGGQLPDYGSGPGERNQYRLTQFSQQYAWQWRGFGVQQELHWKRVEDQDTGRRRYLVGGYLQGGWFPATNWSSLTTQWELAARYAYVDPDLTPLENTEFSLASNWFFNGHRNKLTAEASYLRTASTDFAENPEVDGWRLRLQWDISI